MKPCYVCGTGASAVICHDCVKRKDAENAQLRTQLVEAEAKLESCKEQYTKRVEELGEYDVKLVKSKKYECPRCGEPMYLTEPSRGRLVDENGKLWGGRNE